MRSDGPFILRPSASFPVRALPRIPRGWPLLFSGILIAAPADAGEWITASQAIASDAAKNPIALQFRREFTITGRPRTLRVNVSADQRYVLYVNGRRVAAGPSRGDLQAWRYAAVDLAPYLKRGRNVLAAEVWSDGRFAPLAQITSGRTAFLMTAEDPSHADMIDSGNGWTVRIDDSRTAAAGMPQLIAQVGPTFYAAGGPETIDAARQSLDWRQDRTTAVGWQPPVMVISGNTPWKMMADRLPQMRYDAVPSGRVVRANGISPGAFPKGRTTIAAHSTASLLIDAGRVLAAYPRVRTTGGKGSVINLTYAEALYDPANRRGGPNGARGRFTDRATVATGEARGLTDTFKPDGRTGQSMQPFWWRTWRFLEVKVTTGNAPLTIEGLDTFETGYPFVQHGRFVSDDPQLNDIWRIGWATGKLDAHETYMDTAYWEQLQYIGDTRIQMLLSYDVSGDPRLAIQALDAFNSSRQLEGVPQSAWPETNKNLIPPFALLWIGTLHDYWMRQPDTTVVTRNLEGMRSVLAWYAPYLRDGGILRPTPGWPFVDWRPRLDGMSARDGKGPDNCVITMIYYGALREAAALEEALGDRNEAERDRTQAERVSNGIKSQCWAPERGLFADTPQKDRFSQHANILAVLYDLVPQEQQRAVLDKVMVPGQGIDPPAGITGVTYYFAFYLARALDHAAMGERYADLLKPWRGMLAQNFTTWPENPDPSRSDSHAWSAHPTSGLLTYVAGIQPAAPGFARVRITPNLGQLKRLDAAMAHPSGLVETRYIVKDGRLSARIRLPAGLTGDFVWHGRSQPLRAGTNRIVVSGVEQ